MSEEIEAVNKSSCASCGIAEVDDIKLMKSADCDLVRHCVDEFQRDHAWQHEEVCKNSVAELRDDLLFKQPESTHLGDCPICCLPLPLCCRDEELSESVLMMMSTCCSKIICNGCCYADLMRHVEAGNHPTCPFCRKPVPETIEENDKQRMKRIEVNDPEALTFQGREHYEKGDFSGAFELWTKSAELGDMEAHFSLGRLYHEGEGVEKDSGKEMYHLEEAAIGGHPKARHDLGYIEWGNGNIERAVKHCIIAATQGEDDSVEALIYVYKRGFFSKEELAVILRAHQAAVDATKSPQREAAKASGMFSHGVHVGAKELSSNRC